MWLLARAGWLAGWLTNRRKQAGEELTHCYRPDWRMGTANRRKALRDEYGFDCRCSTCLAPELDD